MLGITHVLSRSENGKMACIPALTTENHLAGQYGNTAGYVSYARLGHLLHVPCALREPINLDTTHLDADVESGFELLEWLEGMVGGRLPFRRSAGMNCCAVSRSTPMSGATSSIRVLALDVYNPGQPRYEITTSKSKVRSRRQCQLQLGVCAVTRPQSYIRDRQYVGRTRPGGSSRFFFRNH